MPTRVQIRDFLSSYVAIDRRSLALMRILCGSVVLYDLIDRIQNLSAQYGVGSIFPPEIVENGLWQSPWPFLFKLIEVVPHFPLIVFIVAFASVFFLIIGWNTRIATVFTWVSIVAIQMMNPLLLQGGDTTIRLILFLGMFLPWGDRFSIDAAFSPDERKSDQAASLWTFALLLQLSFIYLFAGLEKSTDPSWLNGTAVYHALSAASIALPAGTFLLGFPALLTALTYLVRYFQLSVIVLMFSPLKTMWTRTLACILLICMHLAFAMSLRVGIFSWISIAFVSALIPTYAWNVIEGPWSKGLSSTASQWIARNYPWMRAYRIRPVSSEALAALSNAAAVLFIIAIVTWNYSILEGVPVRGLQIVQALGLDQRWNIFAPPPELNGWDVVEGVLADGSIVNLFNPSLPVPLTRPADITSTYGNGRWMEYFLNLWQSSYDSTFSHYYAAYLCRTWNDTHPASLRLEHVSIFELGTPIGARRSSQWNVYQIADEACSES